jgi:xanthine dehydrogenase accessory factor
VTSGHDPACDVAHGRVPQAGDGRTLVAVFASPVAEHLLHFGAHLGYRAVLVEPAPGRAGERIRRWADVRVGVDADVLGPDADVVVTDHHRAEFGEVLQAVLAQPTRWVGLMGSPRHVGPHVAALSQLGVPEGEIARVHRPIGLNIGSRTPAEIAVATLAGLIADRNGRPGGFAF